MIKLAYIIQCHKNYPQINRMIKSLNFCQSDAVSDFYVHVDKKTIIEPKIIKSNNVFFVDESIKVNVKWGQFSIIDATLSLLRTAVDSKRSYDYIWFLSGQDYPIKSQKEIIGFIEDNYGNNFIHCIDGKSIIYKRFSKRNAIPYSAWIESPYLLAKIIRKLYILATGGYYYTFPFLRKKQIIDNPVYYFGSQWFCITYECAAYILDYLDKNPNYYIFFKNAEIPDECFFHTIIFNSPFKERIMDSLCYVHWDRYGRSPKVLTTNDYDNLINSKYLVARKFDSLVDSKILDILDEHNKKG